MSFTTVIFPILAALIAPEGKFLPHNVQWHAINDQQRYFLDTMYTKKDELSLFSSSELRSWASRDHKELNKIAKDNGFDIQLAPFSADGFGSLSILDVTIKWMQAGEKTIINYNGTPYNAAKLSNGFNFNVIQTRGYAHPIVSVPTQSNDIVYITIADEVLDGFDLIKKVQHIKSDIQAKENVSQDYDNIIFPIVNINQLVDISWIQGMKGPGYHISQALQQTKFNMDELGAHVQSAVMFAFEKHCMGYNNLVIDKPFYVWIERKGATIPVFVGYIDPSDWQKVE